MILHTSKGYTFQDHGNERKLENLREDLFLTAISHQAV